MKRVSTGIYEFDSNGTHYYVTKGGIGWNLYESELLGGYVCCYETLREIREEFNL